MAEKLGDFKFVVVSKDGRDPRISYRRHGHHSFGQVSRNSERFL